MTPASIFRRRFTSLYAIGMPLSSALNGIFAAVAVSLLSVGLGASIALASAHHHALTYLLACIAAVLVVGVLFAVPVRTLPGISLSVSLLVPTSTTLLPHSVQGVAVGVVPLLIWIIRAPRMADTPLTVRLLALLFSVWLILSECFAPVHSHHGWEWLVTASIAVPLVVLAAPGGLRLQSFRALFLTISTLLGLYALIEGFLLHRNVLFARLFEHESWWTSQEHSASYRVTTLLGHPLVNGTVFSAAAVLAASDFLCRSSRPRLALARIAILIGATMATHSRGAALALGVGLIIVIFFTRAGRVRANRRLVLTICSILGAAALIYGLQARDESKHGQESAEVRVAVIKRASETVRKLEPFGAGPGESDYYRTVKHLPGSTIDLENSYAELAVSLGLPGLLLAAALLIAIAVAGLRNPLTVGEAAVFAAILVDVGTFNALEGHPVVLVLIGLFAISIIAGKDTTTTRAPSSTSLNSPTLEGLAGDLT